MQGLWLYGQEKTGKSSLAYTISKLTKRNLVYVDFSELAFDADKKNNFNLDDKDQVKELFGFYNEKIDNLLNVLNNQNGPCILFIRHFDKAITHCQKAIYELFADKLRKYKNNNDVFLIFSSISEPEKLAQYCNYSDLVNYLKLDLPSYSKRLKIIDYYIKNTLCETFIKKESAFLDEKSISQNYKCILAKETEGFSCKDIKDIMDNAAIAIKEGFPCTKPATIKKSYKRKKNDCCPTFLTAIFDWASSDNFDKSKLNVYECHLDNYCMNQRNQVERRKKLVKAAQEANLVKEEPYLDQLKKVAKDAVKEGVSSYTKTRTERTLNAGTDIAVDNTKEFIIKKYCSLGSTANNSN